MDSASFADLLPHPRTLTTLQRSLLLGGIVFLFVVPLPHMTTLRLAALVFLVIASAVAVRRTGMPVLPLKIPVLLWAGVALLSVIGAVNATHSIREVKSEIVYALCVFFVFYSQTRDDRYLNGWMTSLMVVCVVSSVVSIIVHLTHDGLYLYAGAGSYTTFVATILPFLLVTMLNAHATRMVRLLGWVAVVLAAGAIATSDNRTVWLAIGASLALWIGLIAWRDADVRRRRWLIIGVLLVPVMFAFGAVLIHSYRFSQPVSPMPFVEWMLREDPRLGLWSQVWERIWQHPWLGVGFGRQSFSLAYPEVAQMAAHYWHPHNLVLGYAIEMGILGVLALAVLFGAIVREFWRLYRDEDPAIMRLGAAGVAMVIAVLARNMTDIFFYRENALLFWALLGMTLGYAAYRRRSRAVSIDSVAR